MAEKIKNFFQKKKVDAKFSRAGPGHRLDEQTPQPVIKASPQQTHKPQSGAAVAAGTAALARLNSQENTKSTTTVKPKLKTNVASTPPSLEPTSIKSSDTSSDTRGATASFPDQVPKPVVQVSDCTSANVTVYMLCPVCALSVPHDNIKTHIEQCLQEEYLKEPLTSSVHMIVTLTSNEDQKKACVETICRYLDNIIANPTEEKYRKIRINNKVFQEKVHRVAGSSLFIEAIGFQQQLLPHQDNEEQFYILSLSTSIDELIAYKELLTSTEPLKPTLDRNPQLFRPSSRINQFNLSDSFYNLSKEEMKREQKLKAEVLERESMLRTKAMRERDDMKSVIKYYKFVLLRIRFPEQVILQGVFYPKDPLSEVRQMVSNSIIDPTQEFSFVFLQTSLLEDTATLAQLGLVPAAVLNLSWESCFESRSYEDIFKPDLVQRIQDL